MQIDHSRTMRAKSRAMSRKAARRDKSARLFLAIAFLPVTGNASHLER